MPVLRQGTAWACSQSTFHTTLQLTWKRQWLVAVRMPASQA
jgi:hypothetical protein